MLRYVSSSISPLIYANSASRFLPHVRFSDLLIFTSSRTGVVPLDAVQFGKMRLPSVRLFSRCSHIQLHKLQPLHKQSFVLFQFSFCTATF